jgi:hypothetical protein
VLWERQLFFLEDTDHDRTDLHNHIFAALNCYPAVCKSPSGPNWPKQRHFPASHLESTKCKAIIPTDSDHSFSSLATHHNYLRVFLPLPTFTQDDPRKRGRLWGRAPVILVSAWDSGSLAAWIRGCGSQFWCTLESLRSCTTVGPCLPFVDSCPTAVGWSRDTDIFKKPSSWVLVAHACHLATQEAEIGRIAVWSQLG